MTRSPSKILRCTFSRPEAKKKTMSSDAAITAAVAKSSEVKEYLTRHGVAAILESFIAKLIENKPDDVLMFLEAWAANERGRGATSGEAVAPAEREVDVEQAAAEEARDDAITVNGEDPHSVVRRTWLEVVLKSAASPTAVAEKIFQILFLQHGALKRSEVFDSADLTAATQQLAAVLDLAFGDGDSISDEKALDLVADHPVVFQLEDKVFQYFLTASHMAISSFFKHDDENRESAQGWSENTNNAWNIVLTQYKQLLISSIARGREMMASMKHGDGDDSDNEQQGGAADSALAAAASEASLVQAEDAVRDSWAKTPDQRQRSIIASAFATLFLQHQAVQRTAFAEFDAEATAELLFPLLQTLGSKGTLSDEDLAASGLAATIKARELQRYHVGYGLQALLAALGGAISGWSEVSPSWRIVLTSISSRIEKQFFAQP